MNIKVLLNPSMYINITAGSVKYINPNTLIPGYREGGEWNARG